MQFTAPIDCDHKQFEELEKNNGIILFPIIDPRLSIVHCNAKYINYLSHWINLITTLKCRLLVRNGNTEIQMLKINFKQFSQRFTRYS